MKNLLVTAESDDAGLLLDELKGTGITTVHLPLEQYSYSTDPEQDIIRRLDSFQFVIYGGLRNARHFLSWVEESGLLEEFRRKIHLVMDESEGDLLDEAGIPAIMPKKGAAPVDILEFLLRISIDGEVLYPCAEESSEEMPGLLQELEMPVTEFTVCRSVPFAKRIIDVKREQARRSKPDAILFHSRGSVTRTKAAFPEIDLESVALVAASEGVAFKLKQEGLNPDMTASGSWKSVLELLRTFL